MRILVGTSKGLILWEKDEQGWSISQVFFEGMPVSLVYVDELSGIWWASLAHRHWGQKIQYSKDEGKSWVSVVEMPRYPSDAVLSSGKRAKLKKIWSIQQRGTDIDEGIWLGTEPGGLFFNSASEEKFQLVEALWNHPSRVDENQWFGAGRDHPFIHSILVDPRDSDHIYIGVSCAGVFETTNRGKSWRPKNEGLIAAYLPNPNAEVGHDPHAMQLVRSQPDVIWQQNHCGIFKTINGGGEWQRLSEPGITPHYGFALAIDHENSQRAWVIPAMSDEERIAPGLQLKVYRTEDGGKSWEGLTRGLPQQFAFDIVFRHSFAGAGNTLVFGSTTGNLFLSEDAGDSWEVLSNYLARIESVVLLPD
ncbi:MAG: glycosyl hydrolase [Bacteroidia bacterium]|nr:glycosyl hydrolase [Bacteroidia bacterium]